MDGPYGQGCEAVAVAVSTLVWVLVGWFVWYSSATVWQADIRLGYFETESECESAGAQLDQRQRYSWEGMEGGPAWLRSWVCQGEAAQPTSDVPGKLPTAATSGDPPPLEVRRRL